MPRQWYIDGATMPLKGSNANRKPNLILLPVSIAASSKDLNWRDVSVFREMKKKNNMNNLMKSFIEVAGKIAFLLYAQDSRHAAPSIQILGEDIVLTIFDRGGSLSTAPFSIHEDPEFFLQLLVSLSTSPLHKIRFDESVIWDEKLKKK